MTDYMHIPRAPESPQFQRFTTITGGNPHDSVTHVEELAIISEPEPTDRELMPRTAPGRFKAGTVVETRNGSQWRVEAGNQRDPGNYWKRIK